MILTLIHQIALDNRTEFEQVQKYENDKGWVKRGEGTAISVFEKTDAISCNAFYIPSCFTPFEAEKGAEDEQGTMSTES